MPNDTLTPDEPNTNDSDDSETADGGLQTGRRTSDEEIWVEKHRPSTLDEVVGQRDITEQLASYVEQGKVPNLLFAGPAGIGKTTSAVAVAQDLYGSEWEEHFLELNASDDRGIDVIRDRVKSFARTSFGEHEYRLIFLDEADSLTAEAQAALRRTMERFSHNIRFILSCNYSNQIIDPIQSRCSVQRFSEVGDEAMIDRLHDIAEKEDITITEGGEQALLNASGGDMRQAVSTLQAASVSTDTVGEEIVYKITSTPEPDAIQALIESAIEGDFYTARDQLNVLLTEDGLSGNDILEQIHQQVWGFDVDAGTAVSIMQLVGDVDYRLTEGANERIQLEALLAELGDIN